MPTPSEGRNQPGRRRRKILVRLAPVLCLLIAAGVWIVDVEGPDAYASRNLLPLMLVAVLAAEVLRRGNGRWTAAGWQWPLGVIGFAIPSVGLSLYLHYGYQVDLNGMYSDAVYPRELFRYLPAYTIGAGVLGFLIGWRIGRNV